MNSNHRITKRILNLFIVLLLTMAINLSISASATTVKNIKTYYRAGIVARGTH